MADVILNTGTGEKYETPAEAYAVVPLNAANAHVIRQNVSESIAALPAIAIGNSGNVKHRWEAAAAVRHDGATEGGVIVDGVTQSTTITTNDWIIQDLVFKVTQNNRQGVNASSALALRTTIRRCVGISKHPTVPTSGANFIFRITGVGSSIWFTTAVRLTGSSTQQNFQIGANADDMFCASYTAAGVATAYGHVFTAPGESHGSVSLYADGPVAAREYFSVKTTMSYLMGDTLSTPGSDPLDLSDLLLTFAGAEDGVFNSSDGTDWGINPNRYADPATSAMTYGGIDITGKPGFEAIDIRGKTFDPTAMIDGPAQLEVAAGGGGAQVSRDEQNWYHGV